MLVFHLSAILRYTIATNGGTSQEVPAIQAQDACSQVLSCDVLFELVQDFPFLLVLNPWWQVDLIRRWRLRRHQAVGRRLEKKSPATCKLVNFGSNLWSFAKKVDDVFFRAWHIKRPFCNQRS